MTLIDRSHWDASLPWIDRSDADIDGYLAAHSDRYGFDLRAKLTEWRDNGIVIFEGVISSDLIDQYLDDLNCLKSHHAEYDLSVDLAGVTKPIDQFVREELNSPSIKFNNVHPISKAACRLSLTREVCQFLANVFASPVCVLQSLTFAKGSQQPIHIDYPYVRTQTKLAHLAASWIPLEDISPDSGPLAYYPGSHRNEASGFFDWGNGSILMESDSTRTPMEFAYFLWDRMSKARIAATIFCPKKGDVLIWHGSLAHEGTKIKNPHLTRNSYVTHYTSLAAYPATHMRPRAIETGAHFSENGGYVFDYPWITNPKRLPSWVHEPRAGAAAKPRWQGFWQKLLARAK